MGDGGSATNIFADAKILQSALAALALSFRDKLAHRCALRFLNASQAVGLLRIINKNRQKPVFINKWAMEESNLRPSHYQCDALTAELIAPARNASQASLLA